MEGNLETKIFNDPITGLVRRIREVAIRRNGNLISLSFSLFYSACSILVIAFIEFINLCSFAGKDFVNCPLLIEVWLTCAGRLVFLGKGSGDVQEQTSQESVKRVGYY